MQATHYDLSDQGFYPLADVGGSYVYVRDGVTDISGEAYLVDCAPSPFDLRPIFRASKAMVDYAWRLALAKASRP